MLVKSETIDVQPKGTPEGLDPIDPEHDLIGDVRVPDAAAALQFQDAWNLTLTATRYQLQMLKQTSIEQALLRQVITRSDRVAVQALYRMRSNRQRLQIQLPDEVAQDSIELDTDPLRINGRRVSLERGDDNRSFFVPLIGITANEPFVLELRYTTAGSGQHLTYPYFPDEPATQKVNLVAYVPQERSFLGNVGPWTDELNWVRGPLGVQRPVPRWSVDELLQQLTKDINLSGNPLEDFPVDGRPLLFSTLRPPAPDAAQDPGALRLNTLSTRWLHGWVFGLIALAGILLLARPFTERIIAACVLLALIILLGVFLPTFARAVLNQILLLAVLLVLLLWFVVLLVRSLPKLAELRIRWPRRQRAEPAAATAAAPQESPPAAAEGPQEEGGTSHES